MNWTAEFARHSKDKKESKKREKKKKKQQKNLSQAISSAVQTEGKPSLEQVLNLFGTGFSIRYRSRNS